MNIKIINFCLLMMLSIWLKDELYAQDFAPLLVGSQIETTHKAKQTNDQTLVLQSFYDYGNKVFSAELYYDSLLSVMPLVNSVFSSLVLYDENMHLINEVPFLSTKDSIFVYQNFVVHQLDSVTKAKEIMVFGTLLTPTIKTRLAIWLDAALNEKRKIIYDPDLFFYIKNFEAHFIINDKGNLITNVNGSTVELNNAGKVVQQGNYPLGRTYFQNNSLDYLTPLPHGLSISNKNFDFIEFREINYPEYPTLLPSYFYSYKANMQKKYVLLYTVTAFDFNCEPGKNRNVIMKYNTETYEAETFYQDSVELCGNKSWNVIPGFDMDYFSEDYIFICNKHINCGFINLDIDGENVCNVEFIEVLCVNKNGQLRWRREIGGDASYLIRGLVATPDSSCVIFANRYERGINSGVESDLYYAKLNSSGKTVKPIPVSIFEPNTNNQTKPHIYPNPVKEFLNFSSLPKSNKPLQIEIFDLNGKQVLAQAIKNNRLQITHLPKGMYTYVLKQNEKWLSSDKLLKF